jgi:transposase
VAQRWVLIDSEHRRPQAQRAVDKQLLKQRSDEGNASQTRCRTAFACDADAQQALSACGQDLQATYSHQTTLHPTPRDATRGRPSHAALPDQGGYRSEGALASAVAARAAVVAQHRCVLLATKALDDSTVSPRELREGDKGQQQAERGVRFLKDPLSLASSWYLKKPPRIMALLMAMTVCLLVYAALEYRLRKALKAQQATVPNHKGHPIQPPTARWVFHYFGGIYLLLMPGHWPLVLNLTDTHASTPPARAALRGPLFLKMTRAMRNVG